MFVLAFCIFRKQHYIDEVVPALQRLKVRHFGHDQVVLHERDTGVVVIARDRFGIKPLYLAGKGKRLRFASTLPALLAAVLETVRRLLARLGFDPEGVGPRVAAGTVSLESLMESLATSSACRDDRDFVRQIWVTVFERAPNGIEERVLLSLLRKGGTRRSLIERVVRMTEFRQTVSRPRGIDTRFFANAS